MIEPVDEVNPNVIKDKMQQTAKDLPGSKGLKPGHQNRPLHNTNPRGYYTSARRICLKLDAKNGNLDVYLDKESTLMTTFNNPFAQYKFQ